MRDAAPLSRRAALAALSGGLAMSAGLARAAPVARVAALSWQAAQALAAIGPAPVCATELDLYARLVVEPPLPAETLESGLRPEPNLERLLALDLDLIVTDDDLEPVRPRLSRIAPVEKYDAFAPGEPDHYAFGQDAMRRLADRIGRREACESYLGAGDATLAAAKDRLSRYDGRPLLVVSVVDGRRALVFGTNSLLHHVMRRLGLENAWTGPTSPWGHAVVTLDRLASAPEARFVNVGNERLTAEEVLIAHPVVGSLPAVRQGRITTLPAILFYGGAPAAIRFARLLGERLPVAG